MRITVPGDGVWNRDRGPGEGHVSDGGLLHGNGGTSEVAALRYIKIHIPNKKLNSQKDTVRLQKSIGIGIVWASFCSRFSNQFRLGLCFASCMDFFGTPKGSWDFLHGRWKLLERTELMFGTVWPGYLQNLCRELLRCCSKLNTCVLTS